MATSTSSTQNRSSQVLATLGTRTRRTADPNSIPVLIRKLRGQVSSMKMCPVYEGVRTPDLVHALAGTETSELKLTGTRIRDGKATLFIQHVDGYPLEHTIVANILLNPETTEFSAVQA